MTARRARKIRSLSSRDDDVRAYVRAVGRTAPLPRAEEEVLLAEYARSRDAALGRRMAASNMRLVIAIAAKYSRFRPATLPDLVQEGTLGLMEAVLRYDPGRKVRFGTYATWWIRAYVLKHLLDNARLVRAGRTRRDRRAFFRGQPPPAELSLDARLTGEESAPALCDTLPDSAQPSPDRALEDAQFAWAVQRRAAEFGRRLPVREAAVFQERMLADEGALQLRDLAERFDVTPERIRQIELKLLADLRSYVGRELAA